MGIDDKPPYFSKIVRIADVTSTKECLGMKERTIEVTVGNSEKPTVYTDPKDVADVKQQDIKEMLLELFTITDEIASKRDFKFVDKYVRENK